MTGPRYFAGPNEKAPPPRSQQRRLQLALADVRRAQNHVKLCIGLHRCEPELSASLRNLVRGLHLEEQALCAVLGTVIDRDAKAGRQC